MFTCARCKALTAEPPHVVTGVSDPAVLVEPLYCEGCATMLATRDTLPPYEERTAAPRGVPQTNEQLAGYVKETSDEAIRQLQSHCVVQRNEAKRAGRLVAAGIWEAFRSTLPNITKGFEP